MRILITNNTLDVRAGSELYVRDLALALLERGHQPIAYSRHLGEVAIELRQATVTVVDDLAALGSPPDIIHAQHHLEAMTALACFPNTPAIYVCHGWLPAEEAPPRHPRLLRYVAVDELVRRRLVDDCGLPSELIEIHSNSVDLKRFTARERLPAKPTRAAVFSNQVSEATGLPHLREACEARGIELATLGRLTTPVERPHEVLGTYELVFAKARAALEAAAVGCAVVICDAAGLGPMINSRELDELRRFNFGVRWLRDPITAEGVLERIDLYDPQDAHRVTQRLRQEAGLEQAVDRLVVLYEAVREEHASSSHRPEEEIDAESRALSHYLRHGPLAGGDFFQVERACYQAELTRLGDRARSLADQLGEAQSRCKDLSQEVEQARKQLTESRVLRGLEAARLAEANRLEAETSEGLRARLGESEEKRAEDSLRLQESLAIEQARLEEARGELHRVTQTRTWRLRSRLTRRRGIVWLYRTLLGLDRSGRG